MESSKVRAKLTQLLLTTAVLTLPAAHASLIGTVSLSPGGSVVPGLVASGTSQGTLLASLSAPYVSALGSPAGTMYSAVYREGGGTLDFYYQVTNLDTSRCGAVGQPPCDPIARETDVSFLGTATSVGFRLDGGSFGGPFIAGTVIPVGADRNGPGDVVGFSFTPPDASKVQPGQVSSVLIISTNATNFTSGFATITDGGATTVASFAPIPPTPPVPEPASFLLSSGALAALVGIRRSMIRR